MVGCEDLHLPPALQGDDSQEVNNAEDECKGPSGDCNDLLGLVPLGDACRLIELPLVLLLFQAIKGNQGLDGSMLSFCCRYHYFYTRVRQSK